MNPSPDRMAYPPELVLRVNELYHDLERGRYEHKHPEIFVDETRRWQELTRAWLPPGPGRRVLDLGTGTGFVPLQIGPLLADDDELILSDISAEILNVCRENLTTAHMACRLRFLKTDGQSIPLESGSVTLITANSVLHHVPDLAQLAAEIYRLLAPGGLVIVAHEPTRAFAASRLMRANYRLVSLLANPRRALGDLLRALRLIDVARRVLRPASGRIDEYQQILQSVNQRLRIEGLISKPLTADDLTRIVDIHSPTAGGVQAGRGIDLAELAASHLPGYIIEHYQTYEHLSDATGVNHCTRAYDRWLRKRRPDLGATFAAVLRKP